MSKIASSCAGEKWNLKACRKQEGGCEEQLAKLEQQVTQHQKHVARCACEALSFAGIGCGSVGAHGPCARTSSAPRSTLSSSRSALHCSYELGIVETKSGSSRDTPSRRKGACLHPKHVIVEEDERRTFAPKHIIVEEDGSLAWKFGEALGSCQPLSGWYAAEFFQSVPQGCAQPVPTVVKCPAVSCR